ncbi:transmembrane protein 59-like isoform X2 [Ammospiza nelsoni]|uniref:transmembrane protein 59-like isoform X2 n=1 Tax=Ammospiza nelsoni TaxID=2857394 RepID=UPI00286D3319|nr:transmembrane protein 59-like isoform X2 [Ammospiza nelsoni]
MGCAGLGRGVKGPRGHPRQCGESPRLPERLRQRNGTPRAELGQRDPPFPRRGPAMCSPLGPELGDTGGCRGQCGRSLQRRAAADAVLNACYRGCRLFSICHFVDASAELNTTRAECEAACAEAYGNAEEQFGCVTGCRKQLPEVEESRKEKSLELKLPAFSMLDLVSTFCNDIVSSAQSFISSTWTFYLQADDGKVVVFQSQPEMEFPAAEALEIQPAQPGSGSGSSPGVPQPHTGPRAKGDKPPVKEPRDKAKAHPPEPPQQEHDFLGCMSKRSGLPRWILAACLFLSIMVMLWLSCASLVTAPEQHVKTQVRAPEHQRGQGVPGGPGRPRPFPAASRHHRHPVPRARRGGRGAAAPQGRPGQDHPVGLPSLPTASASLSPTPRHRPTAPRVPRSRRGISASGRAPLPSRARPGPALIPGHGRVPGPAPLTGTAGSRVPLPSRARPGPALIPGHGRVPGPAPLTGTAGSRAPLPSRARPLRGLRGLREPGAALPPPGMRCGLGSGPAEPRGSCQGGQAAGSPAGPRAGLSVCPARSRRGPAALRARLQRWAGGSRLRWGMESVCSLRSFGSAYPRPPTLG